MQNEINDSIAVQVAHTLFIAFHKLRTVGKKDQLPGGFYYVQTLTWLRTLCHFHLNLWNTCSSFI